jgi:hypothetical protein
MSCCTPCLPSAGGSAITLLHFLRCLKGRQCISAAQGGTNAHKPCAVCAPQRAWACQGGVSRGPAPGP